MIIKHVIGCWVVAAVAGMVTPSVVGQPVEAVGQAIAVNNTPEQAAGHCVRFLHERSRVLATRADTLDPLMARSAALESAFAVLALPAPRPAQARTLRDQCDAISEEIAGLYAVLDGRLDQAWAGRHRSEVVERIAALERTRSQKSLLAQAHQTKGRDRAAMLETVRVERQRLSEQLDSAGKPFEQRLTWLRQRVVRHGEAFEEAMRGFGKIAEVDGVSIQAVRIHATIVEGRLTFSWTDGRGAVMASAHLWLRMRPDAQLDPPLVLDRYPVLLQNRQEAQISAGHFLIDFRVNTDELSGEARVLDAATRLMDIDGLGRLVPRIGSNGLD